MEIMIYEEHGLLPIEVWKDYPFVPNVGDKVCIFLGGIDDRYCNGEVTERLFYENCVALTIDSEDKPLSNYEKEARKWSALDEDW